MNILDMLEHGSLCSSFFCHQKLHLKTQTGPNILVSGASY